MRIERLALLCLLCLGCAGCAFWQRPELADVEGFRQRAQQQTMGEVTVRAHVLNARESQQILGADVTALGIEPVWVEIDNGGDRGLTLLQSGTDPDYFSPLEVSWSLHRWYGGKTNTAIDQHLQDVAIRRGPIPPGTVRAGLIFTNPHKDVKLLNIDLLGEKLFLPFVMLLPISVEDGAEPGRRRWQYAPAEIVNVDTEQALSKTLHEWLSGELLETSNRLDEPLNLVMVGRPADIGAVLVRRGYRVDAMAQDLRQELLGRTPDYVLRKAGRGGVPANWIRMWALPLVFQGRPVLVAQTGAPVGGRFASAGAADETDPALDEVRDMVVQDMLYSGGVIKLAIAHRQVAGPYAGVTDGRVGVLFVAARPLRISDLRLVDWGEVDWSTEPEPYSAAIGAVEQK